MRCAGRARRWLRGLIVVLWRAGLRICEALALAEADLDRREMASQGVPLIIIQLGHTNRGITSIYLQGATTPRSLKPSTPVAHRRFPSTARSGSNAATGGKQARDSHAAGPRASKQATASRAALRPRLPSGAQGKSMIVQGDC
jgi:hypothetical protein